MNFNFWKAAVLLFVFACLPLSSLAVERPFSSQVVGEVAFEGNMTPAEIMTTITEETLTADPAANVAFVVSIPSIAEGTVNSNDLTGLPVEDRGSKGVFDRRGSKVTDITVKIPFSSNDFVHDGHFDAAQMQSETDSILSGLANPGGIGKLDDQKTQDFTNSPNCGGYPLGSTVTVTSSSCYFGTTVSRYECMPNANGGRDWFLTGQDFYPADVDCIDP